MPEEINRSPNLENNTNNNNANDIFKQDIIATPEPNIKQNFENKLEQKKDQNIETGLGKTIEKINPNISTTSSNTNQSNTTENQPKINNDDLELEKTIEDILGNDLSKVYESLNETDKKKFKESQHETSIKIIAVLKSVGGNIKKAIKNIFTIVYKWMNSLKNIKNRAFIEKITKLKVEKILQTQEEDDDFNK